MKVFFWFISLLGVLLILRDLQASNINAAAAKPAEVYVFSFTSMPDRPLTPDQVKSNAIRRIILQAPHRDPCLIEFSKLRSQPYHQSFDGIPDVRLVFAASNVELAFTINGELGYVNGKAVAFKDNTIKWFKRHLLPLAPIGHE